MGKDSGIEWTTHTWNPWRGCHKVSAGCKNCYMFREQTQRGKDPNVVVSAAMATFTAPRSWTKPAHVFTCSYSDFFIEEADPWRVLAWAIIKETPHLTYQILTKRPENISGRLPKDWGDGYKNVWLGVSVENQECLGRIDELSLHPAVLRFVSHEPLLGLIDMGSYLTPDKVNWGIIGGESDRKNPREAEPGWIGSLILQYKDAGVPVFVKQLGSVFAKKFKARDWKGADPTEWPSVFRIREMPD